MTDRSNQIKDFARDLFIRSSYNSEWVYSFFKHRSTKDSPDHHIHDLLDNESYLAYCEWLFEKIEGNLLEQVTIAVNNDELEACTEVSFHEKFGWTVSGQTRKAYLGKINKSIRVKITIGCSSYFSGTSSLQGKGQLEVGKYSSIADGVWIDTSYFGHPLERPSTFNFGGNARFRSEGLNFGVSNAEKFKNDAGVTIGSDVWIARNVTINNNVKIGNGAIVYPNAIVTRDCLDYGVYAGIPAKLVRMRFSEQVITELKEIQWWNWSIEKMHRNSDFFQTDLSAVNSSVKDLISE